MARLDDARLAIEEFKAFRSFDRPAFEVSDLYSLSGEDETAGEVAELYWPATWPHADRSGVYLIFDADLQLLYVGKASMSNKIFKRLATYFGGGQGRCRIKHSGWTTRPQFVVTVAVPDDSTWEAAGLEEFLILRLQPIDNVRGCLTAT